MESDLDRINRERAQRAAAERVNSDEQREFLRQALSQAWQPIAEEIEKGAREGIGGEVDIAPGVHFSDPKFSVTVRLKKDGYKGSVVARLVGRGPEFADPAKIHYELEVVAQIAPIGIALRGMTPIRTVQDMYGPGRPGVQSAEVRLTLVRLATGE